MLLRPGVRYFVGADAYIGPLGHDFWGDVGIAPYERGNHMLLWK